MVLKKGSLFSANSDSVWLRLSAAEVAMMGRQTGDQSQLFYLFNLEGRIPASHLLRRINPVVTRVLADLRENCLLYTSPRSSSACWRAPTRTNTRTW